MWTNVDKSNKKRVHEKLSQTLLGIGALGANRTRDTRIRNPVLYPLSYEGCWNISNQAE